MASPLHPQPATPPEQPPNRRRRFRAILLGGVFVLSLLLVATLFLLRRTDEEPENPPVGTPQAPLDPRVKAAIDRGVAYLKVRLQDKTPMNPHQGYIGVKTEAGVAGLIGLALLECDVSPDDPSIRRVKEIIYDNAATLNRTYTLAGALFFLNRLDEVRPLDGKDREMARSFVLRLIAGQGANGIWSYGCPVLSPDDEVKLAASLREGVFKPTGGGNSMSCTQFAMLAVWGSRKYGVQVRDPLLALAAYFHANQLPDGRWIYPGNSLAATSTCAGLIGLAIETAVLQEAEFAVREGQGGAGKKRADVDKAFEFLAKTIGRKNDDPNPGRAFGFGGTLFDADAMGDLYFLWTLERVGVIYSADRIAGKDWYKWGHPIVLGAQEQNGSWDEKHRQRFGPEVDTPFALLFLKRANIAKDLTSFIRRKGG